VTRASQRIQLGALGVLRLRVGANSGAAAGLLVRPRASASIPHSGAAPPREAITDRARELDFAQRVS